MAKIRFLMGKGKELKLKRNVPSRLQRLAEKTAWTERVASLSMTEIKKRAALFFVFTNAEIDRLDRKLIDGVVSQTNNTPPTEIPINELEIRQLAIWYFSQESYSQRNEMNFNLPTDHEDYAEVLGDAGSDVEHAQRQLNEGPIDNFNFSFDILKKASVFANPPISKQEKKVWVRSLMHDPKFILLCKLLARADLELSNLRLKSLTNGKHTYVPDPMLAKFETNKINFVNPTNKAVEPSSSRKTITIKQLTDSFLAYKKEHVGVSRYDQYKIPSRLLSEYFQPDTPISQIDREKLLPLVEFLPSIPAYVSRNYPNMTILEASNVHQNQNGELANRYDAAKDTLQIIRQIFDHAINKNWRTNNPAIGYSIDIPVAHRPKKFEKKAATYQQYSNEELDIIFSSFVYSGDESRSYFPNGQYRKSEKGQIIRDQMYWLPLLGLWTGMRQNEILQLERGDVQLSNDGIWFLTVTDEEKEKYESDQFSKLLKSENAVRDIPLHPFLLEIGFISWVKTINKGRLFPDAHRGKVRTPVQ